MKCPYIPLTNRNSHGHTQAQGCARAQEIWAWAGRPYALTPHNPVRRSEPEQAGVRAHSSQPCQEIWAWAGRPYALTPHSPEALCEQKAKARAALSTTWLSAQDWPHHGHRVPWLIVGDYLQASKEIKFLSNHWPLNWGRLLCPHTTKNTDLEINSEKSLNNKP